MSEGTEIVVEIFDQAPNEVTVQEDVIEIVVESKEIVEVLGIAGPVGPQGPAGTPGAQGPAGNTNVHIQQTQPGAGVAKPYVWFEQRADGTLRTIWFENGAP